MLEPGRLIYWVLAKQPGSRVLNPMKEEVGTSLLQRREWMGGWSGRGAWGKDSIIANEWFFRMTVSML